MNPIDRMEQLLSADDAERLKSIYAPVTVGIPAEDARRSLCVMPSGEIRCYGYEGRSEEGDPESGKRIYLSSFDCGLTWKQMNADPACMGAAFRSPKSGKYVTFVVKSHGVSVLSSFLGPDDPSPKEYRLFDSDEYYDVFQPVAVDRGNRLLCVFHRRTKEFEYHPIVAYSADDGESWETVELESAPRFPIQYPHKSIRWNNNGAEPAITELPDGSLYLLARTSQDYFYEYRSVDGGKTWSSPKPSRFHGTLTTPFLLRMRDGRYLLFWNNNRPLAEIDKKTQNPPQSETGHGEDFFSNRDACHAAVSRDFQTWEGFREMVLNPVRNRPDFRTFGNYRIPKSGGEIIDVMLDRSVHQFQAIELPFGKILLSLGQRETCRKLLIFDPDWLCESSRTEDFATGLENITNHLYLKSYSGWRGNGYCQWNRIPGAVLMPSPDGYDREGLQICRIRDPRLYSELQGAVWNFPAMQKGRVEAELHRVASGILFSLCDHWMNPCDEYVGLYSALSIPLDPSVLPENRRVTVRVCFDLAERRAALSVDGNEVKTFPIPGAFPNGISYLHLQTLAREPDSDGTYVYRLSARKVD